MTLFAYQIPLDKATQRRVRGTAARQTDTAASLQTAPTSQATGADPTTRSVEGAFGGDKADELAQSLEELGNPPDEGYGAIPVYGDGSDDEPIPEGYYVVADVQTEPVEPSAFGPLAEYTVGLEAAGTRQSQWRAVETAPVALTSDFGTAEEPYVGVPATAAAERYWFNAASSAIETASSVETIMTEFGDVDLYDPSASTFSNPTLLYDLALDEEGKTDLVLWDRQGTSDRTDANGIVQWQRGFSRSHEFQTGFVLSNRRVRLEVIPSQTSISAERYSSGSWSSVSLGNSDWAPVLADVAGIDPAVIEIQLWFRDTSTDDVFRLDARLHRGWDGVLFTVPDNESGPTPSGLQTLLDPIATSRYEAPSSTTTLVARSEVRR